VPDSSNGVPAQHGRLTGYALALLAAACWATGGLMAKWLFTDASAATASWPIPPLGIHIEPTALAAGRACPAFGLLPHSLAIGRRRDHVLAGPAGPFFPISRVDPVVLLLVILDMVIKPGA